MKSLAVLVGTRSSPLGDQLGLLCRVVHDVWGLVGAAAARSSPLGDQLGLLCRVGHVGVWLGQQQPGRLHSEIS